MSRKFKPESDETLKKLVRETQKAAGADHRTAPPHRVRQRLEDQASGEIGVDDYVKRQSTEQRRRPK